MRRSFLCCLQIVLKEIDQKALDRRMMNEGAHEWYGRLFSPQDKKKCNCTFLFHNSFFLAAAGLYLTFQIFFFLNSELIDINLQSSDFIFLELQVYISQF